MADQKIGALIKVRGLSETARAFKGISDDLSGELRSELDDAIKPVAVLAEQYALADISHLTAKSGWAEMRTAVAKSTALAYMVPMKRRSRNKRKRENFGPLLLAQMEKAAEDRAPDVERNVEKAIDRLSREEGF